MSKPRLLRWTWGWHLCKQVLRTARLYSFFFFLSLLFCSIMSALPPNNRSEVNFMETSFLNLAQKVKK